LKFLTQKKQKVVTLVKVKVKISVTLVMGQEQKGVILVEEEDKSDVDLVVAKAKQVACFVGEKVIIVRGKDVLLVQVEVIIFVLIVKMAIIPVIHVQEKE
tara:strand:+ start:253 stop:552 length:300 start_codon:yes stop_codon:yes gene_type:complete